jgi:hypothetical protein
MLNGSPAERLLKPITDYIEAKGGRIHTRMGCRCAAIYSAQRCMVLLRLHCVLGADGRVPAAVASSRGCSGWVGAHV